MTKSVLRSIVGFREGAGAGEVFSAVNPTSGQALAPTFSSATPADVDLAARLAAEACDTYGRASGKERGALLRKIAEKIELIRDDLVNRAHQETALAVPRLHGETARTCGQLRLF